jgi:metal-responsive CopG/Arc/MetJ family transcriptional regulator
MRRELTISVCTRLDEALVRELDDLAERNFSDRSKVVGALVAKVLSQAREQGALGAPLAEIIRRIKLEPVHGRTKKALGSESNPRG